MQYTLSNQTIEKLKYDLVREKIISYETLSDSETEAKKTGKSLARVFVEANIILEKDLLRFIETKLKIPSVELNDYTIDKNCLDFINSVDAKKYKILPLFKIESTLTIAMADPLNLFVLNHLINETNCEIEPIICSESSINEALKLYYPNNEHTVEKINSKNDWRLALNTTKQDDETLETLVFAILNQAASEKMLEIRLDSGLNGLNINFYNGVESFSRGNIPILLTKGVISKLKTLAGLDSSVDKLPQLGKIKFLNENVQINSSVATFPTIKGERFSIKLYNPPVEIEDLSINSEDLAYINECLDKSGIIFVVGKEMSGKTSVVYSLLNSIQNKTVITIEPIIKYELKTAQQCELKEKVGLDISKAMKFIEFQSLDVAYFESAPTTNALEYINSLSLGGKTIITEFLAENIDDFIKKFDFSPVKNQLKCIINVDDDGINVINGSW